MATPSTTAPQRQFAHTFTVNSVPNNARRLDPLVLDQETTKKRFKSAKVEAIGTEELPLVKISDRHGFIHAVGKAFDKHYPLILSPGHFWLMIMQGVANHIELHSGRLRDTFVEHAGKEYIEIRRDEFVKGSSTNDWPSVFPEFCQKIREKTKGAFAPMAVRPFSTTTVVEQAAQEITLMAAMKEYFRFGVLTECGFPRIHLEGTVQDWHDLRDRVEAFQKLDPQDKHYGLWMGQLKGITQKLVDSAEGRPDIEFWNSFFKLCGGSGGPFINGWINAFFPYMTSNERLRAYPAAAQWQNAKMWGGGANIHAMPKGLSCAPFVWHYHGKEFSMKFIAGFMGVEQDPDTLALRPGIGWVVAEQTDGQ